MSFNRRGPDRRPDRPPRREGYSDRPPRRDFSDRPPRREGFSDRPQGGGYPPRDRPPRPEGGDRPQGGRPYAPRRFDRPPDEGAMSIRLDPRRLGTLKHLAGEAGVRPGDLVRQWVEERIDAQRTGPDGQTLEDRVAALEKRVAALSGEPAAPSKPITDDAPPPRDAVEAGEAPEAVEAPAPEAADPDETAAVAATAEEPATAAAPVTRRRRASAVPTGRVALHDEMIAVLSERGPMAAGELATAIAERGRYAPPRSGRPLDAAMVSQRASNPTYRSRFQRREGRIGLAEGG